MKDQLSELRRLRDAASPLPLRVHSPGDCAEIMTAHSTIPVVNWSGFDDSRTSKAGHLANAAYLVAAANLAPTLGDELDAALDSLRWLHDLQNGPPLPKYEKDWTATMAKTLAILKRNGR